MKRFLREAVFIISLSLAMALLYNVVSPTGIKLNRKPMPASQEQPVQAR
jgi:hypothetical protein